MRNVECMYIMYFTAFTDYFSETVNLEYCIVIVVLERHIMVLASKNMFFFSLLALILHVCFLDLLPLSSQRYDERLNVSHRRPPERMCLPVLCVEFRISGLTVLITLHSGEVKTA